MCAPCGVASPVSQPSTQTRCRPSMSIRQVGAAGIAGAAGGVAVVVAVAVAGGDPGGGVGTGGDPDGAAVIGEAPVAHDARRRIRARIAPTLYHGFLHACVLPDELWSQSRALTA